MNGEIQGVMRTSGFSQEDSRGIFRKVWQSSSLTDAASFQEIFWTRSKRGVIRGMHMQLSPASGYKLVWVSEGFIDDVVLDLRRESGTYGEWVCHRLSSGGEAILIPEGCAHGFEVRISWATVNYAQSCKHDPVLDTGVRWDSFGFSWTTNTPILSARDLSLPLFCDFVPRDS